jgi:hypothetical protein
MLCGCAHLEDGEWNGHSERMFGGQWCNNTPPPPHLQSSLHLSRSQSAHIVSPKSKDCRLTEPFIFCCGSKERLAPLEAVWRGLWQRRMRKALVMCLCIHFEKKWAERSDGDHWDDFEKKSQGQIFCHVEIRDARPSVNFAKR